MSTGGIGQPPGGPINPGKVVGAGAPGAATGKKGLETTSSIAGSDQQAAADLKEPNLPKLQKMYSEQVATTLIANKWMQANPMLAFTTAYLEMAASLSRMKVEEAYIVADMYVEAAMMTLDIAVQTHEISEKEAEMYRKEAYAAVTKAVASGATLVASFGLSRFGSGTAKGQIFSALQNSFSGMATNSIDAWLNFQKSKITLKKGDLEAAKVVMEGLQKMYEKYSDQAAASQRNSADDLNKLHDLIKQLDDKTYDAIKW